ncbi:aminotransferase class I/II-fold pyridoxal phosphate-dependent enzyme [Kitasatospora sp. CM 4170]|uniref:Aminotransferase class I/II-fold pyridoxal phosphate-dependent enzyme n=1 Tax=Kitasatospora aburaviensis TaxID=67265 RepID=A0ABW1ES11_9ACTN|nr:aminotransferase class I/II-fold pyridoxal phosphate-dependent enzyme [Kitasatospora sp. CM 4170]WNM44665.1 aminotransferase class I/II-fold pyridoxal phosphate-dependent enzyme [Kitasatospora sp. CM 4170]
MTATDTVTATDTAADEEALLAEPLERFGALHAAALRRSGGVIDLSYPNPLVHRDPRAFELLRGLLDGTGQDALQYTPFGGGTVARRKAAAALAARTGVALGYRDLLLTPGATAALNTALAALFAPGDEVLVVTPCWMDYFLYLRRLGLRATAVPSGPDKRLDLDALAAALGPRTAGVIISQPVCPTGVLHDAGELAALARVLETAAARWGRRPVLISDEVHRDQNWGGTAFTSPMRLYPDTVSLYSYGKAWSLQGQRTGYLALGPGLAHAAQVRVRAERALRSLGHCAPTALMQRLVERIAGLTPDCAALRKDQHALRALLTGLGYRIVPGEATAFLYAGCPGGLGDWEFTELLAGRGVIAMPSSLFHEEGYFRLALNVGPERFGEIARSLRAAFEIATANGSPALRRAAPKHAPKN